ncbi:MAG TPA: GlsB/YeaQ/YmgE family stress response membrane protein [Streptosporangiaceae bacterium]|nr:GlsB/YeaQ/YmgE family stress response membrane protein [Streptosporangiaceae bacterium]
MLIYIIVLLVVGLVVGGIARLLVPGQDPIGCLGTIAVGILGSLVGGFLENLIFYHSLSVHRFRPVGLIGSVIGAVIVLLLLRWSGLEAGHRRRH